MKNKDAVLIATASAAGLYWYAQSRKPKLVVTAATGFAAGFNFIFTAFGKKVTGFRGIDMSNLDSYPIGTNNLAVEADADKIYFTLYDAAGKAVFLRVVNKDTGNVAIGAVIKKFQNIQQEIEAKGFQLHPIRFRFNGTFQNGFAITDQEGNELYEVEPVWYSNGDRWKVVRRGNKHGVSYLKSLRGIADNLELIPGHTGFKFAISGMTCNTTYAL